MIQRIKAFFMSQLRQGVSPRDLALTIAVVVFIGTNPFIGTTTVLCLAAGLLFRLNHPIVQALNYALFPAQIALIIPWTRVGEYLTGSERVSFSPDDVIAAFHRGIGAFWADYAVVGLHAVIGWLVVAPFPCVLLFVVFKRVFRKLGPDNMGC